MIRLLLILVALPVFAQQSRPMEEWFRLPAYSHLHPARYQVSQPLTLAQNPKAVEALKAYVEKHRGPELWASGVCQRRPELRAAARGLVKVWREKFRLGWPGRKFEWRGDYDGDQMFTPLDWLAHARRHTRYAAAAYGNYLQTRYRWFAMAFGKLEIDPNLNRSLRLIDGDRRAVAAEFKKLDQKDRGNVRYWLHVVFENQQVRKLIPYWRETVRLYGELRNLPKLPAPPPLRALEIESNPHLALTEYLKSYGNYWRKYLTVYPEPVEKERDANEERQEVRREVATPRSVYLRWVDLIEKLEKDQELNLESWVERKIEFYLRNTNWKGEVNSPDSPGRQELETEDVKNLEGAVLQMIWRPFPAHLLVLTPFGLEENWVTYSWYIDSLGVRGLSGLAADRWAKNNPLLGFDLLSWQSLWGKRWAPPLKVPRIVGVAVIEDMKQIPSFRNSDLLAYLGDWTRALRAVREKERVRMYRQMGIEGLMKEADALRLQLAELDEELRKMGRKERELKLKERQLLHERLRRSWRASSQARRHVERELIPVEAAKAYFTKKRPLVDPRRQKAVQDYLTRGLDEGAQDLLIWARVLKTCAGDWAPFLDINGDLKLDEKDKKAFQYLNALITPTPN